MDLRAAYTARSLCCGNHQPPIYVNLIEEVKKNAVPHLYGSVDIQHSIPVLPLPIGQLNIKFTFHGPVSRSGVSIPILHKTA